MTVISNRRLLWMLSSVTFLFLSFVGITLYIIPYRRLHDIHTSLPYIFLLIISGFLFFTAFYLLSIVIGVTKGKGLPRAEALRKAFFKFFYPIMALSGKIMGVSKEKTNQIFMDVNNFLIRSNPRFVRPERLLVLLPHCIQFNECHIKITGDVHRCGGCGRCGVKDLAAMAKKANIYMSVATGGGIARRIVQERKPQAIIAVACERELSGGIIDSYPLPIIGIINQRPYGYCFNTSVDLHEIKDALRYFIGL